ncbi:response regulator transcription factor [Raoultibacter timonensis]|uniref:DNA-binding response regulator n=1 Tax=Raoultibacter timonensis TaxID=1907662 RepID=A0ABM7WGJ6_9ACTN|nr:response regulator transcription factor [Raoultibacter timonensis]BDE95365.1 DNA-binding response regulator [Raoultibacter timonensis]BDF49968.1 DNA-binding response regulator [Raoultibacter timonensis]
MSNRILVADDEPSVLKVVKYYAEKNGYRVDTASDGESALRLFQDATPDLVVLDIMMPGLNGFEVCEAIREVDIRVPVIFLTAKGDLVDKGMGFKLGADDYVTKPFEPEELIMRIGTCLRRRDAFPVERKNPGVIDLGDLSVDLSSKTVVVRGAEVSLTAKEFDLLAFLAQHPTEAISRVRLLQGVWGEDYIGDSGVVAVVVRKVREKVEENPAKPHHLLTEWGYGYRLV